MKKNRCLFLLVLLILISGCVSQRGTNIQATSQDIADNLDLEAVASVFGDVKNLEEFERILNDESEHLSNLDLNNDGFTDYLRVVESVEANTHVITIQAALGDNVFQDVATIDVDKYDNNVTYVQVIGHPYFYGNNYIINPTYYVTPFYVDLFWSPYYKPWRSPYFWSYYPPYYRPFSPWPIHRYIDHGRTKRSLKNNYKITNERRNLRAPNIQKQVGREDYSKNNPNTSFGSRNKNTNNKADLNRSRNNRNTQTPNARNSNNKSRGEARPNKPKSETQKPVKTRATRKPNPEQNTKPSGSRKSGNSSRATPNTKKNTKREN